MPADAQEFKKQRMNRAHNEYIHLKLRAFASWVGIFFLDGVCVEKWYIWILQQMQNGLGFSKTY